MPVHVEPLADCLPAALAFRNASRGSPRDERYIRWRYLERPSPAPAFVVWWREQGENLAAATVAPHALWLGGRRLSIGIVGDISVAGAARGRGLAAQLMEAVIQQSRGLDGLLVMPNPPLHATLRKGGWLEIPGLARYLRCVGGRGPARLLLRTASSLRALVPALRRRGRLDDLRLEPRPRLPDDYADFWAQATSLPMIAARDASHLEWRYLAHPLHRYELFELRAGTQLAGYAFTRRENADWWVDDWLASDAATAEVLGAQIVARASAAGINSVQTRTQARGLTSIPWRNLGFMQRSDTQAVFVAGAWAERAQASGNAAYFTPGDKDV